MDEPYLSSQEFQFSKAFGHKTRQRAKKVVSYSLVLVHFRIGIVDSVLNLPDGRLKLFGPIELQKN